MHIVRINPYVLKKMNKRVEILCICYQGNSSRDVWGKIARECVYTIHTCNGRQYVICVRVRASLYTNGVSAHQYTTHFLTIPLERIPLVDWFRGRKTTYARRRERYEKSRRGKKDDLSLPVVSEHCSTERYHIMQWQRCRIGRGGLEK